VDTVTKAKLALTLMAAILFAGSMRMEQADWLRYLAIGMLVLALLLRFARPRYARLSARGGSRPRVRARAAVCREGRSTASPGAPHAARSVRPRREPARARPARRESANTGSVDDTRYNAVGADPYTTGEPERRFDDDDDARDDVAPDRPSPSRPRRPGGTRARTSREP
jgi:hypothetical protein